MPRTLDFTQRKPGHELQPSRTTIDNERGPLLLEQYFNASTFPKTLLGYNDRSVPAQVVSSVGRAWDLLDGSINYNAIMTLSELSSRFGSWSTAKWERAEKRAEENPFTHKLTSLVDGGMRGSIRVPQADSAGINGKFTRISVASGEGELAAQSVVVKRECDSAVGCDSNLDGIWVGLCPYIGKDTDITTWGKFEKLLGGMQHAYASYEGEAKTMSSWTSYWKRSSDLLWHTVDAALAACDQERESEFQGEGRGRCPLFVGGNSMGGFMAGLAAFDLSRASSDDHADGRGKFPNIDPAGAVPREIRVVSVNSPRVGNDVFVDAVNTLRIPLVRVINDGDLVPAFPQGFFQAYPVDQGGLVLATVNFITIEKTSGKGTATTERLRDMTDQYMHEICDRGRVYARSGCHTSDCDTAITPVRFAKKLKNHFKHHGILSKTLPALLRMGEELFDLETNLRGCASRAVTSGLEGGLLDVWKTSIWGGPNNLKPDCQSTYEDVESHCLGAGTPAASSSVLEQLLNALPHRRLRRQKPFRIASVAEAPFASGEVEVSTSVPDKLSDDAPDGAHEDEESLLL